MWIGFVLRQVASCRKHDYAYSWSLQTMHLVEWKQNLVAHGEAREENWRGNRRMEWVASSLQLDSEQSIQCYYNRSPPTRTPRKPVLDWTDTPADINELVRFAGRPNLVSALVPSHSVFTLLTYLRTYSMEQSSSWETNWFSASRRNFPLFVELTFLPQCVWPSFTPIENNKKNYSSGYLNLYIFGQQTGRQTILHRLSKHSMTSFCS